MDLHSEAGHRQGTSTDGMAIRAGCWRHFCVHNDSENLSVVDNESDTKESTRVCARRHRSGGRYVQYTEFYARKDYRRPDELVLDQLERQRRDEGHCSRQRVDSRRRRCEHTKLDIGEHGSATFMMLIVTVHIARNNEIVRSGRLHVENLTGISSREDFMVLMLTIVPDSFVSGVPSNYCTYLDLARIDGFAFVVLPSLF